MRNRTTCLVRGVRDLPQTLAESAEGRFAAISGALPLPPAHEQCLRCWVLPDACFEALPVPAKSSKVYDDKRSNSQGVGLYKKSQRPFRLHVAGLTASDLGDRLSRLGGFIKDPLFSQILRHLERDIVWADNSSRWPLYPRVARAGSGGDDPVTIGGDDELTMVWPYWEKGYGDVIANTLLPFGELLRDGRMPRHLAISGMRHVRCPLARDPCRVPCGECARPPPCRPLRALFVCGQAALLPPLKAATATLCASERPNLPLLPQCDG